MPKIALIGSAVLVLLLILVITVSLIADWLFSEKVNQEVCEFFNGYAQSEKEIIQKEDLEGLPPAVQRWLEQSHIIGKERVNTVRLKQSGQMRLKDGAKWMPFEAVQYFRVDEPGFIWKAKIKPAPFFNIVGRDRYSDGHGNMLIRLLSFLTISDAAGKEIDQGSLMRYFAEMQWFPMAALSNYITWEEIDENSAKATIGYQGVRASAIFTFNDKGQITDFAGERYMEKNGEYSLETWTGSTVEYGEFNGIRIPCKGEVTWKLKQGDFTWLKWEINEVEYNKPKLY